MIIFLQKHYFNIFLKFQNISSHFFNMHTYACICMHMHVYGYIWIHICIKSLRPGGVLPCRGLFVSLKKTTFLPTLRPCGVLPCRFLFSKKNYLFLNYLQRRMNSDAGGFRLSINVVVDGWRGFYTLILAQRYAQYDVYVGGQW